MNTLSQIVEHKIVAIVRGADSADVLKIAEALCDGGIRILEVTINSPNALQSIQKLSELMRDKMQIGAGTVLSAEIAKAAIMAGATFIISPYLNFDVIKITKQLGAVSIPGAYTPTEIVNAFNGGGDIVKVFPASSNVNYIKEIRAPLSHIPLIPTGGINKENIREYFSAGVSAVGIGTALVSKKNNMTAGDLRELTENARQFVQAKKDFFST
jgi:2-dehydro-3-deoxyphosphogluconate aldolase/(4S)-4-hydroxy-2-oxoglutarate aldolase